MISIIIPTYNRPQMLYRALSSIKTISSSQVEIIVCDDKSTEENKKQNSEIICRMRNKLKMQIKYYENNRRKGVSGTRNTAIKLSKGDWIMFLDDDAEFISDYIDYITSYLSEQKNVDILWSNVIISKKIGGKELLVRKYFTPRTDEELFRDLISIGIGYGVVVRKTVFMETGLFNENLQVAEDTDFFFRIIKFNKKIFHVSNFGVVLHDHEDCKLTKNYEYHAKNHIFRSLYRKYFDTIVNYDLLCKSFTYWISDVYKENQMKKEVILFHLETVIRNLFHRCI